MTRRISAADVGLARPHKYGARRALACRTCGIVVDKHDDGERVREWHTMGHPDQDCTGELLEFDSTGEARTFIALAQAEYAGYIEALELQPVFELRAEGGVKVGTYRADFRFVCEGRTRVVDVKGHQTPLSAWKRKHTMAQYDIDVEIWKAGETAL